MSNSTPHSEARWRLAWLLLTVAFAAHVLDETLTDFLSFYNPLIESTRQEVPWLPFPTFTFEVWLTGLIVGVLILFALTPLTRRDRSWMRWLSYLYGVIMTVNGLGHIAASLMLGRPAPGVVSSPFLLAAALFLLASVPRNRRAGGQEDTLAA